MSLKIDVHCHVDTSNRARCEKMLDDLEASMEKTGVAGAIVMPLATKGFDALNELETLVTAVSVRSRLKPMLCYDKVSGKACAQEIIRLLDCATVAGVKFFTGYDAYGPCDDEIAPILDSLEKRGKVAKFHTGATARTEHSRLRFSNDPYAFDELAILRPELKIDCAHFMAPNHLAMAPVLDKNDNVSADLSGLIDSYRDNSINPYAGFVRYRLADALAYLPTTDRLMFGSDFPFCDQAAMVAFINSFFNEYGYTDEQRDNIWSKNARELYGFTGC